MRTPHSMTIPAFLNSAIWIVHPDISDISGYLHNDQLISRRYDFLNKREREYLAKHKNVNVPLPVCRLARWWKSESEHVVVQGGLNFNCDRWLRIGLCDRSHHLCAKKHIYCVTTKLVKYCAIIIFVIITDLLFLEGKNVMNY